MQEKSKDVNSDAEMYPGIKTHLLTITGAGIWSTKYKHLMHILGTVSICLCNINCKRNCGVLSGVAAGSQCISNDNSYLCLSEGISFYIKEAMLSCSD